LATAPACAFEAVQEIPSRAPDARSMATRERLIAWILLL
jgi:hypothetical protein